MALDDEIRDRIDRIGYNRICFGLDTTDDAALDRLVRLVALGRELADLCEQRAAELRHELGARP